MTRNEKLVHEMLLEAVARAMMELDVPFELRLPMFRAELQKLCVACGVTVEFAEDGSLVIVDAYNQAQSVNLFEET